MLLCFYCVFFEVINKTLSCLFRKRTPTVAETPGSARRMLDSIEKSFNKVRHVLTPKKQSVDAAHQPQILTTKVRCLGESKMLSTNSNICYRIYVMYQQLNAVIRKQS